jgi:hypothetical protein
MKSYLGIILIALIAFGIVSCKQDTKKWLSTKSGIQYKLIDFGDENYPITIGEQYCLNQQVIGINGDNQLIIQMNDELILMNYVCKDGALEIFKTLYLHDSVHAKVTLHQLMMCGLLNDIPVNYSSKDTVEWRFRIKKSNKHKMNDISSDNVNHLIVEKWIGEGDSIISFSDLFLALKDTCSGQPLQKGDKIRIVHKTTRTDGSVLEYSTYKEPFELIVGQQDQIIEGMQIALGHMCKGQRVRVLIPSKYSFSESFREQAEIFESSIIAEMEVLK